MSKIKCDFCGNEINEDSNFCMFCGHAVKKPQGLLSKLIYLFKFDKNPKETYEYFISIESGIEEFKKVFSKNEYISKDLKLKLKNDYETQFRLCTRLKNFHNNSNIELTSDELNSLNSFLDIYKNIDEKVKENNVAVIDVFYNEFVNDKENYQKFIDKYKTDISYEELISEDSKLEFKDEYDYLKNLVTFEKNDNYDLKDNKKFIHEFISLYDNFKDVVEEIKNEIYKREKIQKNYEENKKYIVDFISEYKDNDSTGVYIENYKDILNKYRKSYDSCLELSKLPEKYHKQEMNEFLDLYNNFEDISKKINESYINYRYDLFKNNQSEISLQTIKFKNLSVDEYLEKNKEFLNKFEYIHEILEILLKYGYDFNNKESLIIKNFCNLFDDFNGAFPSKYYNLFLNYDSSLKSFILSYGANFECKGYIFNKFDVLKVYDTEYNVCKNIIKLNNADELVLNAVEEEQINTFIDIFDNFDEVIEKNNFCYVEKLNNEFLNQEQSILNFIKEYSDENIRSHYIVNKEKEDIMKFHENNHALVLKMIEIPDFSNNDVLKRFISLYDNFDQIIFEINKNYVNNLFNLNFEKINEYVCLINLSQNFYVSNEKLNELLLNHSHYLELVLKLSDYCSDYDYLEDKSILIDFPQNSDDLIHITPDANKSFIKRELKENKDLLDNVVKGKPLDESQRKAVVIDEDNTQIIAGAGCGKTLTLQAKAKYLIERKGINPGDILAISFSKLSSQDLEEKMDEIGIDIDVSTFHSLGLRTLRKNKINAKVLSYGLKDAIKEYFVVKLLTDEHKIQKIIEYFGYYMYNPLDKENIDNIGEVYDYERGMDLETLYSKFEKLKDPTLKKTTLAGEKVKSLEERRIANFLFLNGVEYTYEKDYEAKIDWQKTHDFLEKVILNNMELPNFIKDNLVNDLIDYLQLDEYLVWPNGDVVEKYHPDFYLDDYDIYYEHFGVNRNCLAPWLPRNKRMAYKREMRNKRLLHKRYGTKLIETYSYYNSENRLLERLKEKLTDCGVEFKSMDYQQFMIDLLNDEEKINEYWDFIKLVETFISLFKGNGYQKDKFEEFRKNNEASDEGFLKEKHQLFLEIVEDIYDYYYEYLKKHNAIDFNDMINDATELLKNQDFHKNYKYILVDEFQDTSHTRFNFLKTLKDKLNCKLIVVGDDWQSIYRFTGCDIDLFTNFKEYFDDSKTEICYITNTYRNSQSLIDVSGNFIMKNESQFKKQLNSKSNEQINDTIKLYQYLNYLEQPLVFEEIINYIYQSSNGNDVSILVLGRNRSDYERIINEELFYTSGSIIDKNLKIHYKKNPRIFIRYMTVHGSKGLEEDNVVLINLEDRKSGFPNKIEDDSVLSFVKNEKDENIEFAEERRLFYVALTRTKKRTYLLAPKDKKSTFVNEIIEDIEIIDFELKEDDEIHDDKIRVIASTEGVCPDCGTGKINLLYNPQTGKKFFKCSNWPRCDWYGGNFYDDVSELNNPEYCPKCGGLLVKKNGSNGLFYGCINYFPDKLCRYTRSIGDYK